MEPHQAERNHVYHLAETRHAADNDLVGRGGDKGAEPQAIEHYAENNNQVVFGIKP